MNLTLSNLLGTLKSTFKVNKFTLDTSGLTAARTVTAPDKGGTLAMTSDVPVSLVYSGSAQASTSGTSIDFTSIPSWVKRISIQFVDVSTNGSANVRIRIGTGGTPETTGYLGASGVLLPSFGGISANYSGGFDLIEATGASAVRHGSLVLSHLGSNKWTVHGLVTQSDTTRTSLVSGSKALAGVLDMVSITTTNGTDSFDAGSLNILYE